ncbi:MAG: TspO/MBR family protein [Planctomycetota bacterium]
MNTSTSQVDDSLANRSNSASRNRGIICFALSFVLLALGGWLTSLGLGEWYSNLDFPPYQPPGWAFTPAWTLILGLLALATWRITDAKNGNKVDTDSEGSLRVAMLLYCFQFALNVGWSLLFFALKRPDFALWEIVVLDVLLVALIVAYRKIDSIAGWMLVPYFVWLLFATAINAWISIYNGPFGV